MGRDCRRPKLPEGETAERRDCERNGDRDCRTPKQRPRNGLTPRRPNSETAELRNGLAPKRPNSETALVRGGMVASAMRRWHATRLLRAYWLMPPRRTLRVIDAAEDFAVDVHRCFSGPGRSKFYADQARRAAGSVYSNLIEGFGRGPGADRMRVYRTARSECEEALGWIRLSYRIDATRVARIPSPHESRRRDHQDDQRSALLGRQSRLSAVSAFGSFRP